jgi:hypothetical protein
LARCPSGPDRGNRPGRFPLSIGYRKPGTISKPSIRAGLILPRGTPGMGKLQERLKPSPGWTSSFLPGPSLPEQESERQER